MSETDKIVAEILSKALEGARQAGDFIVEQAPEVIQQLLLWKLTHGVVHVAIGAAVLWGLYKLFFIILAKREDRGLDEIVWLPYTIGAMIFGGFAICGVFYGLMQTLKILIAPKLFLLEYAASLVK